MRTIQYAGNEYAVSEDGFLLDPSKWDENWVDFVMRDEKLVELTKDHRELIRCVRDYYVRNGVSPQNSVLSSETGFKLKAIYELFPSGPGKGLCRMAGLPRPTGCI